MNKNINLCKILKGLEGIELYSPLFGKVILSSIEIEDGDIFIETSTGGINNFNKDGRYYGKFYPEAECLLFPSKDQRDWSKFVPPLIKDTPVLCCNDAVCWKVMHYKGINSKRQHEVYHPNVINSERVFKYVIPYNKFNPNNIKESLKYNIQI